MGKAPTTATNISNDWQINSMAGLELAALIVLSLGIIVAVIWTWRSLDPSQPLTARLALALLRFLALATCFGLVLQPVLQMKSVKADPEHIAVLIDISESMTKGAAGGRLETLKKVVESKASKIKWLESTYKTHWYTFADQVKPLNRLEDLAPEEPPPNGTDIRQAITTVLKQHQEQGIDGLVLISDGADTEITKSKHGEWRIGWANRLGVPFNTVSIGDSHKRKDLAIESVDVEPFAYSRGETPISVTLSSIGYPDMETESFLWQQGSVLQKRKVKLFDGRADLVFTVIPKSLGTHVLTVTVPVPEDDEAPENNRVHATYEVSRDKIRILHLAGHPSWDQRFLRQTLASWPIVDLVSFYVLRTEYQSTNSVSAGMALIPFPTKELFEDHLSQFDVVIFQEFEPAAVNVDQYSKKIAEFIKQGGALAVIGGEKGFDKGQFGGDALLELLPIKLLSETESRRLRTEDTPFRPRLTEGGSHHPLTRLKADIDENTETWCSLARLDGTARIEGLAKDAFSLAEHPYLQTSTGPTPVISVREVGKGRTLAITTDSLWRWRFTGPITGGPTDIYDTFWHRAISWLTKAPELERLRISVSPSPVVMGSSATIQTEVLSEVYRPIAGIKISSTISWIGEDGVGAEHKFNAQVDSHGRYRTEWSPQAEGPHQITVTSEDGLTSTRRFLVETKERERSHLAPQPSLLESLADATGGHFEEGSFTPHKIVTNKTRGNQELSRQDSAIWDNPFAILLFFALLTAEWILRRRMGIS